MLKRAFFTTLGCKLNQAETAQITEIMDAAGIVDNADPDNLDPRLVFINTCAVTEKAAAKSRHTVSRLAREYPDAVIVAGGCLAQHDPQSLLEIKGVNYVVGTAERFSTDWWVGKKKEPILAVGKNPACADPVSFAGWYERSRPMLKIQDGCDQGCTYCVVPNLRGKSRSVPLDLVLAAMVELLRVGAYEIVLTGVRIGSWGRDLKNGANLIDLVRELTALPGDFRIRLGSVEPWELNIELIDLVISHEKVCPHLHIPLQHTEKEVLAGMGRPEPAGAIQLLMEAKSRCPEMALGVDLIAGFPGETEDIFSSFAGKIRQLPLSYLHAFGFSPRRGTAAFEIPGKFPRSVVRERVGVLNEIREEKMYDFKISQVGRIMAVIPERQRADREWTLAVSENYIRMPVKPGGIRPGRPEKVRFSRMVNNDFFGIRI